MTAAISGERALVAFASSEGQTAKIAREIAATLADRGLTADVVDVGEQPPALDGYDVVVVGGSVHTGHHQQPLTSFVREHHEQLNRLPGAFFSVSLTAVKADEAHQGPARKIAEDFLAETGWTPEITALFGGALKYSRYNFLKRFILKRIARKEGGDTDTSRDWEYTDWDAVHASAGQVADLATARTSP